MSEQLEAAVTDMRESELALRAAEKAVADGRTDLAVEAAGDSLGHLRNAVNNLVGAVQSIEIRLDMQVPR